MRAFVANSDHVLKEGLRLAGWNTAYIAASAALFILAWTVGFDLLRSELLPDWVPRKVSLVLLTILIMLAIIAIAYLALWLRFLHSFARQPSQPRWWQAVTVSLIGVLPNPVGSVGMSTLLADNEACGVILASGLAWLAFFLPPFVMPLVALVSWSVGRLQRPVKS